MAQLDCHKNYLSNISILHQDANPRNMHFNNIVKYCDCISEKTYNDTLGNIAASAAWHLTIPFELSLKQYLELRCPKTLDAGLKLIIPRIKQMPDVLIYHACSANVYTASKRDCLEVPTPNPDLLKEFLIWYDRIFDNEIVPILEQFDYHYNGWYNTLDLKQQIRQDKDVNLETLEKRVYCNFCKKEKQICDDDTKNPKNRCICGPNEEYKYVVGPITHSLEHLFKHKFKGYSSGKTWQDHEQMLNNSRASDLRLLIQGDCSGYDRTQHLSLKEIEFKVYRWLAQHGKITHVEPDIFLSQSTREKIKVLVQDRNEDGTVQDLGYFTRIGGVQTGNMDTTFANTLRMALYNRFIIEYKLGVHRDAYSLQAQGDDFAVELPSYIEPEKVEKAYMSVMTKNKIGEYGLGQTLKFLSYTDLDGMDFCSTETFFDEKVGYKMIRKLDRFLTLTPWSQKALHLNSSEQREYMLQLWEANQLWIGDLPIYKEYNDLLKAFALRLPYDPKKVRKQKSKTLREVPSPQKEMYESMHDAVYENNLKILGRDEAYALKARISDKKDCKEGFIKMLHDRYGLSTTQIRAIQDELIAIANRPLSEEIDIPDFKAMMEVKDLRTLESRDFHNFRLKL